MRKAPKLTHLDAAGNARMVEVGMKGETTRVAVAAGTVKMSAVAFDALRRGAGAPPGRARTRGPIAKKGDVLAVARIAGIMAAKRTAEWIPLCHPVPLTSVEVEFTLDRKASRVGVTATTRCIARTGVEMEALTAVSAAALTIYDMLKAIDRGIEIERIRLLAKSGGKSGDWTAA